MSCSWLLLAVLLAVAACEGVEASALRKDGGLDSALGGCAELGLCCQGKNNTCRVRRHRNSISDDDGDDDDEQNSVLVKARRNICYCDSACLDLADCCPAPAPRGGFWRLSLPSALLKPPQILKRATKI